MANGLPPLEKLKKKELPPLNSLKKKGDGTPQPETTSQPTGVITQPLAQGAQQGTQPPSISFDPTSINIYGNTPEGRAKFETEKRKKQAEEEYNREQGFADVTSDIIKVEALINELDEAQQLKKQTESVVEFGTVGFKQGVGVEQMPPKEKTTTLSNGITVSIPTDSTREQAREQAVKQAAPTINKKARELVGIDIIDEKTGEVNAPVAQYVTSVGSKELEKQFEFQQNKIEQIVRENNRFQSAFKSGVLNIAGGLTGIVDPKGAQLILENAQTYKTSAAIDAGLTEEDVENGIVGNLTDGNFKAGLTNLYLEAFSQTPQLALMYMTGGTAGIGILGASAGGAEYARLYDRVDISNGEKILRASLIGITEALTERLGSGDINMALKALGKKEIKNIGVDVLKNIKSPFAKQFLEEGGEELIAGFTEQIINKIADGEEIDVNSLIDQAIIGGVSVTPTTALAYTVSKGQYAIASKQNQLLYNQGKEEIASINKALNTQGISQEEKDVLTKRKERIQSSLLEKSIEDLVFYNQFSEEDLNRVYDINKELTDVSSKKEAALTDVAKTEYDEQIKTLAQEKQAIENKYVTPQEMSSKTGEILDTEKPQPNKVTVLDKEVNQYNNYIPEKAEDVEEDAIYTFTSDNKDGIPEVLREKANVNKADIEVKNKAGETVRTEKKESWSASINGKELIDLFEQQKTQQQQTDETAKQEEPMLEGVQATRDETKVGQESAELRTEEATQKEVADINTEVVGNQAPTKMEFVELDNIESTLENAFDSKNVGYHGGNLASKSDNLTNRYRGDLPYTGYYFFSNPKKAISRKNRASGKNEFGVVDFSKYNLYKPSTEQYWVSFNGLKKLEDVFIKGEQNFDESQAWDRLTKYSGELGEKLLSNKDNIADWWDEWKSIPNKKITDLESGKERFETFLMKKLGYEGVDVRGLKESRFGEASPDNAQYGSVIFDLKEGTVRRFTSEKQQQSDTQDKTGIPSKEQKGQEPKQAKPKQEASGEKVETGRDVQTPKEKKVSGGGKKVSIGLTPYASDRIPKYKYLNDILNSPNTTKQEKRKVIKEIEKDLRLRVAKILPKGTYKIKPFYGVWGETEISFELVLDLPLEDALFVGAKLGKEFDQDAVHVRQFDVTVNDNTVIGVRNDDGSATVPYATIEFNKSLTNSEFYDILQEVGLFGGTLSENGKFALIYNGQIFEKNQSKEALESNKSFNESVEKLKNYDSKGIQGNVSEDGSLFLHEQRRSDGEYGGRETGSVQGTYGWYTSKFYNQLSQKVKEQFESEKDKTNWARKSLKATIAKGLEIITKLTPKIKDESSRDYKRLENIGKIFDKMGLTDMSPEVVKAYSKLAKALLLQYKDLPIKVYPFGKAVAKTDENGRILRNPDGSVQVEFIPETTDTAYDGSGDMINDVDENNQMVFYTTGIDTFGEKGVDYTGHPLLEQTGINTTRIPVVDKDGNVVKNSKGETEYYSMPMVYNDLLRVVHDYIAHAASGATFGARGEERAWAAHVSSIINDKRINEGDKLDIIRALTTETRGQNTWVNFVSEKNKKVNNLLNQRRALIEDGKPIDEINKKIDELDGIEFSDQKVGLLPTETIIGGYPETKQNDDWVQRKLTGNEYVSPTKDGEAFEKDRVTPDKTKQEVRVEPDEKETQSGKEKTLVKKRVYEGEFRDEVKGTLEKIGLTRSIDNLQAAKAKAKDFIKQYGEETALDAVRNNDIQGAAAAFVFQEVVESVNSKLQKTTDPKEIEKLSQLESDLFEEWGNKQWMSGSFNAAMADILVNSTLGYNATRKINEYKEQFGEIPAEVEKKFRELEEKLKEVSSKLLDAEKRAEEAEGKEVIEGIKESIKREKSKSVKKEADKYKAKIEKGNLVLSTQLIKDLVEGGINNIEDLVKAVKDAIKSTYPNVTEREIRDAITGYGKTVNLSPDDIDVQIRKMKRLGRILSQLEDIQKKKRPLKSGVQRDKLDVEERSKLREVREAMKDLPVDDDVLENQLKTATDNAKERLRNQIEELNKAIESGKKIEKSKIGVKQDAELKALTEERDKIKAIYDSIFTKEKSDESKLKAAVNAVQKSIEEYERRIKEGDLYPKKKESDVVETPRLKELRDKRDELKAEIKRLQDIQNPPKTKEEIATENAIKANKKSIEEKERRIAENDLLPKPKKEVYDKNNAELKALKEKNEKLTKLLQKMRNDAKIKKSKEEVATQNSLKATEKAIAETERRIKEKDLELTKKKSLVQQTAEIKASKERLEKQREILRDLREQAGIYEKKRLEISKEAVKKRIKELNEKLKTKDFSKKKPKSKIIDSELTNLRAIKLRLQEEYDKEFYKAKLNARTKGQLAKDILWEIWGIPRILMATGEASFVLIQGLKQTIAHPLYAIKAFKNAWKTFKSEEKTEEWLRIIKSQDWYPIAKQAKLAITEPNAELTAREELYYSGWSNLFWNALGGVILSPIKIANQSKYDKLRNNWNNSNPLKAVERAAIGYLDMLRILRFLDGMEILEMQGKNIDENTQEYKDVADAINTMTGRASLGFAEQIAVPLSRLFFSPRNWASALKTSSPYALYYFAKLTPTARKMALADMSKMLGFTTSMVMLAAAYLNSDDDEETKVEFDPRSTDFMKIKLGNTRVDPWGGMQQQIVFSSRIIAESMSRVFPDGTIEGAYKNAKEQLYPLGVPYKTPNIFELSVRQATNKLNPTASLVYNYSVSHRNRKGVLVGSYGNEYTISNELSDKFHPIFWGTASELLKDDPTALDGLLLFYAFFGGGVQQYDFEKDKKNKNK